MGDKANAVEFFRQLDTFSQRYVKQELGKDLRVEHGGRKPADPWKGAIIHYTADDDMHRVIRWFLLEESNVSAHTVVHDRKMGCHDSLCADLPMIQRLPATVIQCRHPGQGAWHARWANEHCYGIECVSAGLLKQNAEGELFSWRPRDGSGEPWTQPWASPYKEATELYGRHWVCYPADQVAAVIAILRHLRAIGDPTALPRRPWVLGHDAVQMGKFDAGPAFPIHGVRAAMWDDWRPPGELDWWASFGNDPSHGKVWRDAAVVAVVRAVAERQKADKDPSIQTAWARARAAWAAMPGAWRESGAWVKLALWVLGYAITSYGNGDFSDSTMDTDDLASVAIFQRMANLKQDGIAGPVTTRALNARLRDLLGVG